MDMRVGMALDDSRMQLEVDAYEARVFVEGQYYGQSYCR